jgi:predicted XRE-type DNA-binding protein
MHFGDIPKGLKVCHSCDTPPCVNPKHLWLGTQFENIRDRVNKGRNGDQRGEQNSFAKLTILSVKKIRKLYNQGIKQRELSSLFSIDQGEISRIVNLKRWQTT